MFCISVIIVVADASDDNHMSYIHHRKYQFSEYHRSVERKMDNVDDAVWSRLAEINWLDI